MVEIVPAITATTLTVDIKGLSKPLGYWPRALIGITAVKKGGRQTGFDRAGSGGSSGRCPLAVPVTG